MERVDNKNLYKIYLNDKVFYQSYNTMIAIEENDKIIINEKWFSSTTTKHKNLIIKSKPTKQPISINEKTFIRIIEDNNLNYIHY